VRSGLVVVGVALAVVGAGLTLAAFFEPGNPSQSQVNPLAAPNLEPGLPRTMYVWLQNVSSGSLDVSWVSSADVNVTIYRATDCRFLSGFGGTVSTTQYCPDGPALASWPANSSGHWNTTGPITFPLILNLADVGPKTVNVNAVFDEIWASTSPRVPTWIFVSTLAGGAACITIGGISIFLGLFLRSGVYSGPAPDPQRDPDLDDFDESELDLDDERFDEPPE
jgi:hypothetical protein